MKRGVEGKKQKKKIGLYKCPHPGKEKKYIYFLWTVLKSRHPVLEFSNHHQHNLQSEHTESQFRPAHLLILAGPIAAATGDMGDSALSLRRRVGLGS